MATRPCTSQERAGRLAKAIQFLEAAQIVDVMSEHDGLLDAVITLCVHAGIAASDVICCARLGVYSRGQDHSTAVGLLAEVDQSLARDLSRLRALGGSGEALVGVVPTALAI